MNSKKNLGYDELLSGAHKNSVYTSDLNEESDHQEGRQKRIEKKQKNIEDYVNYASVRKLMTREERLNTIKKENKKLGIATTVNYPIFIDSENSSSDENTAVEQESTLPIPQNDHDVKKNVSFSKQTTIQPFTQHDFEQDNSKKTKFVLAFFNKKNNDPLAIVKKISNPQPPITYIALEDDYALKQKVFISKVQEVQAKYSKLLIQSNYEEKSFDPLDTIKLSLTLLNQTVDEIIDFGLKRDEMISSNRNTIQQKLEMKFIKFEALFIKLHENMDNLMKSTTNQTTVTNNQRKII